MSTSAWIFMLLVWGVVIGMTGYCFYKIMSSQRQFGGSQEE